ncbi:MAG: DUF1501 domain-containing protein [Gemmataceae bacterium]|nr:DUF1501 domain-containing protein [Gemmata sp.]MDW8197574.1 DUF1501 domain-containing protein [Gemmataceae bacterium]
MLDIVLYRHGLVSCLGCGNLSRRDLLRGGVLAGLTLPGGLAGKSSAAIATESRRRRATADAAIVVFLGGGFSHLDTFDPKPEAPAEIRGPYRPIDTAIPGLHLSEHLPLLAQVMDKVAVVRSLSHDSEHHETATNAVLSGRFGSPFGDYPALGAVVAHETEGTGSLPSYVAIPRNPSFTWELGKSAFLGRRYEAFPAGDPCRPYSVVDGAGLSVRSRPWPFPCIDKSLSLVEHADRMEHADRKPSMRPEKSGAMSQPPFFSQEFRRALALNRESEKLRERYGYTTAGQSMLLARRLVEHGVRFVTVNYPGWDHHRAIFEQLNHKLPELDRALSALIDDLNTRGLLARTLLVVMGEFGRAPKINTFAGRDHWSPAASLLLAGAGVRAGAVLGQTDRHGAFVTHRPVSPADVAYTILASFGIDPRQPLTTPDGRSIAILDRGQLINELIE